MALAFTTGKCRLPFLAGSERNPDLIRRELSYPARLANDSLDAEAQGSIARGRPNVHADGGPVVDHRIDVDACPTRNVAAREMHRVTKRCFERGLAQMPRRHIGNRTQSSVHACPRRYVDRRGGRRSTYLLG